MRIWVSCLVLLGVALAEDPGARVKAAAFVSLLPDEALRPVAVRALEKLGADAVPALAAALQDAGFGARREAIALLAKNGSDPAKDALRRAARDRDASVRVAACTALLDLGEPGEAVAPGLASALTSSDEQVRRAAAAGLSKAGIVVPDALERGTESASPIERAAAVTGLGATGAKQSVPRLVELLSDDNENVRVAAAVALRSMGADAAPATARLKEILAAPETRADLRAAAFGALDAIRPDGWDGTAELMGMLGNADARSRAFAAAELGRRNIRAAAPDLVFGLNDMSHIVRDECALSLARVAPDAEETVVVLVAALEDRFLVSRVTAARALGETGAQSAKPALEEAARTGDDELAAAAKAALEKIR
jgi:HEAT repeat protein